jgi:hypothetical protein
MADPHPAYLAELTRRLEDFPARYGKPTTEEREALRCTAPTADLEACHRAVSEELGAILEVLDQYDYREIPPEWQPIANLVLFLAEIDSPIVKWTPKFGVAHLPDALDPRHFETKRNFFDVEPRQTRTLMAERIR